MENGKRKKVRKDDLGSLLHAGLHLAAGGLAMKGYITASMIEPFTGLGLAAASLLLSARRNRQRAS